MRKFLECCAGIDIGKREMTVTILTGLAAVEPVQQTQTFGTTIQELHRRSSNPTRAKEARAGRP